MPFFITSPYPTSTIAISDEQVIEWYQEIQQRKDTDETTIQCAGCEKWFATSWMGDDFLCPPCRKDEDTRIALDITATDFEEMRLQAMEAGYRKGLR
jgi:hypothetical protein